jgi:hypothetical protein
MRAFRLWESKETTEKVVKHIIDVLNLLAFLGLSASLLTRKLVVGSCLASYPHGKQAAESEN